MLRAIGRLESDPQRHPERQDIIYNLDPDARSREVVSEEGESKSTTVNHYPGPGDAVTWIGEGGEKYARDIPGIDGTLSAVEQNGLVPVLQLHDLQGNIVATAALKRPAEVWSRAPTRSA